MKSRHTPRPWHVEDGPDIDIRDGDKYLTVLGPDNHGSPHVAVWDGSSQGGTAEANACLIAAAPDLLAAARHAQCECTDKQRDRGHVVGCWFPALQVAIDKADGCELAAECCEAEAAHEASKPIALVRQLLHALERVIAANPAFRVGTIGSPGSAARYQQEEQIAAEDEALAVFAAARGLPGLAPLPVPGEKRSNNPA